METKLNKEKEDARIIKDTGIYSIARYSSEIFYFIRGFVIAKFLGPSLYGVWSMFRSLFSSTTYIGFGAAKGMLREVPYEPKKKSEIQSTTFTWKLLMSAVISLMILAVSFTDIFKNHIFELRIATIIFILYNIHHFIQLKLQSEQKIKELSMYDLSYAILNTGFSILLLLKFSITGIMMGMFIAHIVTISILLKKRLLLFRIYLEIGLLVRLIKIGLPMMVLGLIFFLMQSIDKFLIFFILGSVSTGYYSLASFISLLINNIPYTMNIVLFPKMMQKIGRTKDSKSIEEFLIRPAKVIAGLVPILIGLFFININIPIVYFLPKYLPSLSVLKILIVAFFFAAILSIPQNFLIALNKHKKLMYAMFCVLFIGAILDVIVIKLGYGIKGVAFATSFTMFLSSAITLGLALRYYSGKKAKFIMQMYLPYAYSLVVLFIVTRFITLNNLILNDFIQSIAYVIFMMPIISFIDKEVKILSKLSKLKKWKK